jgi:hypothetical protein
MGRPLHARKPKGGANSTAACDKDDANADKQYAQKLDLLARMRQRIADKAKGS